MPFDQMRRRDFITLLGGAATWPLAARAQPALQTIGWLGSTSPGTYAPFVAAFRQGLKETGFVDGQNVAIEYRWAEGQYDRLPALAADLVRRQVAVIATTSMPATLAAKVTTTTIPIVFQTGFRPVETGLVASLNRPGGNLTGVTTFAQELEPKRLELLRELVPKATAVAVLFNPANNVENTSSNLQAAARALGLQLVVLEAGNERDLDAVFASLGQLRIGALVIGADSFFNSRSERLAALALHHAVPTIYQFREFAAAGGLMSYGGSLTDAHRLVGVYTGRILKGEKPTDLPVQQATKVELIINLKTAKALGLTVPLALLTRADEVIE
jgi:putative tryptophan/tyrosine transport system substrate-binding protein